MGLIHLDAGVVIGFLDGNDVHHAAARSVLSDAVRQGNALAMSASAYAECLVGPARRGETAINTVTELVARLPISIVAVDAETAVIAARLRADHRSLRLPDALVIATAIRHAADHLVTTDREWPNADALGVEPNIRWL